MREGGSVEYTVTANEGWQVKSVKYNGSNVSLVGNKYTAENVTQDGELTVVFEEITVEPAEYTVTSSFNAEGGSVTVSAGTVVAGGSVEYTVTANEGWQVKSVKYNGVDVSLVGNKYTAENVTQDGELTVVFEEIVVPTPSESGEKKITPLLDFSFDDGSAGQGYQIDLHSGAFWDENYSAGSIVDKFDGKAYRFKAASAQEYAVFGGIKVSGAVVGESYTLTMKAEVSGCDFVFIEYIADNNSFGNSRYGAIKLYPDRLGDNGGHNSFATYNATTKELTFTFTAGMKVWDASTSEPGFIKMTAYNASANAYLDIDDVKIVVADTVMDENCERLALGALANEGEYNKFWNDASSMSVVEYGTGNKAVKFTSTGFNGDGYCKFGYINRLGFVTDNGIYSVSIDYEMIGFDILHFEYVPANGGAGIQILSNGTLQRGWGGEANLMNAKVQVDPQNPAKGTLTFQVKALENVTQFQLTGQTPAASGERALILDNIRIEAASAHIRVDTTEGEGFFSALTFDPRIGTDCKITVTPENGWYIKSVLVDGNPVELNAENAYTFSGIAASHTMTASFSRNAIAIVADASAGVTVNRTQNVLYGDQIVFEVTLAQGYRLTAVKLNGKTVTLSDGKYVVDSATEDLNFIVLAEKTEFSLSYSPVSGGTVTCSADKVQENGSAVYTVTPNEGYRVKSVKYNGKNVSLSADGTFTVENATADGVLEVVFEEIVKAQPSDLPASNSAGKIAGIVCGVVGACAIAAVVTAVVIKKKQNKKGGKEE